MAAWIAYAIAWLSTSAAVCTGIIVTGKWGLLFFMLIPTLISVRTRRDNGNSSTAEDDKDSDQ